MKIPPFNEYQFFNLYKFPRFGSDKRQDTNANSNSNLLGLFLLGVAALSVPVALLAAIKQPVLENDPLCGLTTGGKPECYFDCELEMDPTRPNYPLITDLECILGCLIEEFGEENCVTKLVDNINNDGTCQLQTPSGVDIISSETIGTKCDSGGNPNSPTISKGTCKPDVEEALKTEECKAQIFNLRPELQGTITTLIESSCSEEVSGEFREKIILYEGNLGHELTNKTSIGYTLSIGDYPYNGTITRTNNVALNGQSNVDIRYKNQKITLNVDYTYRNTKLRYPWVCSLKTKGFNPEHLCAVVLLSIPPNPTVLVGAAHCTYICKNGENRVDSCCCQNTTLSCKQDKPECGKKPKLSLMTNMDARIVCGEWQVDQTPPQVSGELNTFFEITEIIRHPQYDTKEGPIEGNDIAVFKVNDKQIRQRKTIRERQLNPACLPKTKARRNPTQGIHAGWSGSPPRSFIMKFAPAYLNVYSDFSKEWHYLMTILTCKDPQRNGFYNNFKSPSDTYYPPGVVCAVDFAKNACFSGGESGAPLMVKNAFDRFDVEGIASFVKGRGCDIYSNNPTAYTKISCFLPWIAKQYGMKYEHNIAADNDCFIGHGDPEDKDKVGKECTTMPATVRDQLFVAELGEEQECIFPFYYKGKLYDECIVFEEEGFTFPVYRCPIRNLTAQIAGINNYNSLIDVNDRGTSRECPNIGCQFFIMSEYCPVDVTDPRSRLDPNASCADDRKRNPFGTCKNNCKGVGASGIIVGTAVLGATALAGLGAIAPIGIGVGGFGLAGIGIMSMMCRGPTMCRAISGQCCPVDLSSPNAGPQCPSRC